MAEPFSGHKKEGSSILGTIEKKFVDAYTPKIPAWIETWHLTYLTILWSILIIISGWLAKDNIEWLWAISFFIILQYFSDLFDGAVGRFRNTGLVKWGYYMDHFLDYIFLCAILISYIFILPDKMKYLMFFLFALFTAFMINSYLSFAITNRFKIAYFGFGPTEARIIFIILNTLIIYFGNQYFYWSLPYLCVLVLLLLVIVVWHTQKWLWCMDMKEKDNGQS